MDDGSRTVPSDRLKQGSQRAGIIVSANHMESTHLDPGSFGSERIPKFDFRKAKDGSCIRSWPIIADDKTLRREVHYFDSVSCDGATIS